MFLNCLLSIEAVEVEMAAEAESPAEAGQKVSEVKIAVEVLWRLILQSLNNKNFISYTFFSKFRSNIF